MNTFVYFIRVTLLTLGVLLLMTGCINSPCGGKCEYSMAIPEIVRVKEITPEYTLFETYSRFTNTNETVYDEPREYLKVGQVLPSEIRHITSGACIPTVRDILYEPLAVETAHIFFSSEGNIEAGEDEKIMNLLDNIRQIQIRRGKLELHGYADKTHSSEYAFSLARGYAEKIKTILMAEGVNEASMVIVSHGNEESAASSEALPANRVDFAVSFVWPEQKQ